MQQTRRQMLLILQRKIAFCFVFRTITYYYIKCKILRPPSTAELCEHGQESSRQACCCTPASICYSQVDVSPAVNLSILSFPRIPACISTVYWSFHFTVGGWRAEEGGLLWFTWVQSKTLSACGCLRQWEVHVFVHALQASSCRPAAPPSTVSLRGLQSEKLCSLTNSQVVTLMRCCSFWRSGGLCDNGIWLGLKLQKSASCWALVICYCSPVNRLPPEVTSHPF